MEWNLTPSLRATALRQVWAGGLELRGLVSAKSGFLPSSFDKLTMSGREEGRDGVWRFPLMSRPPPSRGWGSLHEGKFGVGR